MTTERTLGIIKPDAVQKGVIGEIINRIESSELKVVGLKLLQLTKPRAEGFYAVHRGRPFFDELTTFMSSGPCVVMVLEGSNAVRHWREVMGATNPEDAAEGTLRADYGTDIGSNAVHGSDSIENAKTEVAYFFESHEVVSYDWI